MVMSEIKIKRWGNSLGVIIPHSIIKHEQLNEGDFITIDIFKRKRVDGFGLVKKAPPFEEEDISHGDFW